MSVRLSGATSPLDFFENGLHFGGLSAVLRNHHGGGSADFRGFSRLVDLVVSDPAAHFDVVVHLEQRHLVHLAESRDEALVLLVVAVLGQEAETSVTAVNALRYLVKALE